MSFGALFADNGNTTNVTSDEVSNPHDCHIKHNCQNEKNGKRVKSEKNEKLIGGALRLSLCVCDLQFFF